MKQRMDSARLSRKRRNSLSSIGWRRGSGRGGKFCEDAPLLGPLPAPASRGEEEKAHSVDSNMGQAFQMISGPAINDLLAAPDNRLAQLLKGGKSNQEIIEELYWTALTRPPTEKESNRATALLNHSKEIGRAHV